MGSLDSYVAARDELLARLVADLSADPRFVAAWLTGSFGRGEADAVSDLDLAVVVDEADSASLCARPWITGGATTPERLALVRRFGEPAIIHENHHNAPPDGTFTFVLYARSGLVVDWVLIPRAAARRPARSKLLFDHAGLPTLEAAAPPGGDELREAIEERVAFFWMMAAVVAKYVARRDTITVLRLLEMVYHTTLEIERLAAGKPLHYQRGAAAPLVLNPREQVAAIRRCMARVMGVESRVEPDDEAARAVRQGTLEGLLRLVG